MAPLLWGAPWKANLHLVGWFLFETPTSFLQSFPTDILNQNSKWTNVQVVNIKENLEIYLLSFLGMYLLDTAQNK